MIPAMLAYVLVLVALRTYRIWRMEPIDGAAWGHFFAWAIATVCVAITLLATILRGIF